jgi:hypothetical protein
MAGTLGHWPSQTWAALQPLQLQTVSGIRPASQNGQTIWNTLEPSHLPAVKQRPMITGHGSSRRASLSVMACRPANQTNTGCEHGQRGVRWTRSEKQLWDVPHILQLIKGGPSLRGPVTSVHPSGQWVLRNVSGPTQALPLINCSRADRCQAVTFCRKHLHNSQTPCGWASVVSPIVIRRQPLKAIHETRSG